MRKVCIPLSSNGCKGGWLLPGQIDSGGNGDIWAACCSTDCKYVLKYQTYFSEPIGDQYYGKKLTPEGFYEEISIQEKIQKLGIAPKVIDHWECDDKNGCVIIMEALDETIMSLLNRYDNKTNMEIIKKCIDIINIMHSAGYYHGDLHLKNIMVKSNRDVSTKKGGIEGLHYYLIDFGLSGIISDRKYIRDDFNMFINSINSYSELSKSEIAEIVNYIQSQKPK